MVGLYGIPIREIRADPAKQDAVNAIFRRNFDVLTDRMCLLLFHPEKRSRSWRVRDARMLANAHFHGECAAFIRAGGVGPVPVLRVPYARKKKHLHLVVDESEDEAWSRSSA